MVQDTFFLHNFRYVEIKHQFGLLYFVQNNVKAEIYVESYPYNTLKKIALRQKKGNNFLNNIHLKNLHCKFGRCEWKQNKSFKLALASRTQVEVETII